MKKICRAEATEEQIDESRWDGSDFVNVDRNPGRVLVAERVCSVLADGDYTNYACVPLS